MDYTIDVPAEASSEDVRAVECGLTEYNVAQVGDDGRAPLGIFLRNAQGRIAGGLTGSTWYGWLRISVLWLEDDARGHGYGSHLLALAEKEALRRGCHDCFVDTFSWQAMPFYLKHGYSSFGELDNFPSGFKRHFLQKRLSVS